MKNLMEQDGQGGAPASAEAQGFTKALDWRSGTVIALAIPSAVVVTLGASIGALGALTALCLWTAATLVAIVQNRIFLELASMFPDRAGGVARFAIEGWRRRFAPFGALASFGYWMAWSFSLSVFAITVGSLAKAQWFADNTWSVRFAGHNVGLEHLLAIVAVVAVWAMNYFGVRNTARLNGVAGAMFMMGVAVLVIGAFASGSWSWSTMTWGSGLTVTGVSIWFYLTAWTTYGTEMVLSFGPEYKQPVRDTRRVLNSVGLVMLIVVILLPIAVGGSLSQGEVAANPQSFVVAMFTEVLGQGAWLGSVLMILALLMAMNAGTAAGGRALYGLARDGMTIRQLDHLNRWHVPGRSLTLDAVLNIAIILLVGSPLSILLAGNLGYLVAIILALFAFLLLRRDLPDHPRPHRLKRHWTYIAYACLALNLWVMGVGVGNPAASGYGGFKETAIGIGMLLLAIVLFAYRRVVQDGLPMAWTVEDSEEQAQRTW